MGLDASAGSSSSAPLPAPEGAAPALGGARNGTDAHSRLTLMLRAFAHRNYRLFFAGQFISLCGTFLSQVAIISIVYAQTREPWIVGLTAFAGQIPMLLIGPFAGVWVDRLNRRRLLLA